MASFVHSFFSCRGRNLGDLAKQSGLPVNFACGGAGVCGGCRAEILSGTVICCGEEFSAGETVRLCAGVAATDKVKIRLLRTDTDQSPFAQDTFIPPKIATNKECRNFKLRAALDLGTTTMALVVFDSSGKILSVKTSANPQAVFGADVVSRIAYAQTPQGARLLKESISRCIANLLDGALAQAQSKLGQSCVLPASGGICCAEKGAETTELFVAGNTPMLHLFFGRDVSGLSRYPFRANFLDSLSDCVFEGVCPCRAISLPCIGAFIGADTVAACINSGIFCGEENAVLIDLGTNAEIVVKFGGNFVAASAAAGPAFEGCGFYSSMKAADGAISTVYADSGKICHSTMGGVRPLGICASGYVDFLAAARAVGLISRFGAFSNGADFYEFAPAVRISKREISELIKAKAAVCAALKTLLRHVGAKSCDFKKVYIAGGFGSGLNFANAVKIGFLPPFENAEVACVGNASLGGAYMCALSSDAFERAKNFAKTVRVMELNLDTNFQDDFIDAFALEKFDF